MKQIRSFARITKRRYFFTILMALLLASCASVQQQIKNNISQPEVGYKSISVGQLSSDSIQLLPVFAVTNTNMFSIPVNNVSYQLSLNKQQLIAGNSDAIGTLQPNQSKDITLAMDLSNQSLAALQELLFKNGKIDYLINGKINVLGIDFPFQKESTIFMPKIKLNRINVVKANFNEMELVVDIDIDNRNDFQLPLDNLNYSVSSGATALFSGKLTQQLLKPGNQRVKLPLSFKPTLLFSSVFSLLKQPNLPLTIDVESPIFSTSQTKTLNLSNLF